jgi:signal transduction histidine kinase
MRSGGSVRVRVTALATLIVAVAVTAAGVLLVQTIERALERHAAQESARQLSFVTDQLQSGAAPSAVRPEPGSFTVVQVFDGQGHAVTTGGAAGLPLALGVGQGGFAIWQRTAPVAGQVGSGGNDRYLVRSTSVDVGGDPFTIVAGTSLADVERSVAALKRYLVFGLPGLIVLVAALAWFVVGRALRPVEAMRAEVEAISTSTIHRRVREPARRDELGRLARTMNAMLERLEQGARRQREFVSDASHELRSPIAVIRTKLEVAQRRGEAADWPAVATAVLAEEARLEGLVADLLALAREDEAAALPTTTVSLATVAEEEAARERRCPVRCRTEVAQVRGDGRALRSMVAHLLDNAARHARRRVEVVVEAVDGHALLTVDDDGAGIPGGERARVCERSVRRDAAGARDRGGAGLGLAVVRAVARAHGGDATASESPQGGARLVVVLPLADG